MQLSNVFVAKEQLSYAARLYFNKSEISVVSTLVFSAYGILIDLLKNKDSFRDWMHEGFIKEHPNMWRDWNDEWGFFKHARDGIFYKKIDADFEISLELIIFAAIHDFQSLPNKLDISDLTKSSLEMEIYQLWFIAKKPDLFLENDKMAEIIKSSKLLFPDIKNHSKDSQKNLGALAIKKNNISQTA